MNDTQKAAKTDPQDNGGKLFTQEEVNRIVSERLNRERAKSDPEQQPESDREKALREREEALQARENKLACMAYLKEKGIEDKYHADFEALEADPEKFRKIVDTLGKHFVSTVCTEGSFVATPPATTRSEPDIAKIFAPLPR